MAPTKKNVPLMDWSGYRIPKIARPPPLPEVVAPNTRRNRRKRRQRKRRVDAARQKQDFVPTGRLLKYLLKHIDYWQDPRTDMYSFRAVIDMIQSEKDRDLAEEEERSRVFMQSLRDVSLRAKLERDELYKIQFLGNYAESSEKMVPKRPKSSVGVPLTMEEFFLGDGGQFDYLGPFDKAGPSGSQVSATTVTTQKKGPAEQVVEVIELSDSDQDPSLDDLPAVSEDKAGPSGTQAYATLVTTQKKGPAEKVVEVIELSDSDEDPSFEDLPAVAEDKEEGGPSKVGPGEPEESISDRVLKDVDTNLETLKPGNKITNVIVDCYLSILENSSRKTEFSIRCIPTAFWSKIESRSFVRMEDFLKEGIFRDKALVFIPMLLTKFSSQDRFVMLVLNLLTKEASLLDSTHDFTIDMDYAKRVYIVLEDFLQPTDRSIMGDANEWRFSKPRVPVLTNAADGGLFVMLYAFKYFTTACLVESEAGLVSGYADLRLTPVEIEQARASIFKILGRYRFSD